MTRIRNCSFAFMVAALLVGQVNGVSAFNWQATLQNCWNQGGTVTPWPIPDNRCGLRIELSECYVGNLWDACKDLCESSTPVQTFAISAGDDHCECDVCMPEG